MTYTEKVDLTCPQILTTAESFPKSRSGAVDLRYGEGSASPNFCGGGRSLLRPISLSNLKSMMENCCKSAQIRAPNRLQNHFKTTSQEVRQTQCKSGSPFASTMHEESPWTLSLDCSEPIETTVFYNSFRHLAMFTRDSHNSPHWHEHLC